MPGQIVSEVCIKCNVEMLLRQEQQDNLRRTHGVFYCINGHEQLYSGPTQAEKDRDEYKRRMERAESDAATARARVQRVEREAKLNANKCKHCTKRFETPEALTRHVRRIHEHGPKRLPSTAGPSN